MQAKLLRALQERKVRPVGSNTEITFDSRIVTATHRDLDADVAKERFRQDLFYRINVVRIDVPALRERSSDVLKLAAFFLKQAGERGAKGSLELSPQVAERLMAYDWPGNVRELGNCLERAVALAHFEEIQVEDLPEKIRHSRRSNPLAGGDLPELLKLENCIERAVALARFDHLTVEDLPEKIRAYRADRFVMAANEVDEIISLDEIERRYIIRVIKMLNGNKARAAQLLGLDRRTLYRKLERYEGRISRQQESAGTGTGRA
jgi:two-component system response regulator HydG